MKIFESRIDKAVDASLLGIGENVSVVTKMGKDVFKGRVIAVNPLGVVLEDGVFYKRELYLFCPKEEEQKVEIQNKLHGLSSDERAMQKMIGFGIIEADSNGIEDLKKDKKDDTEKDTTKEKEKDKKIEPKNTTSKDNFDPQKLPDEIKNAVVNDDKISTAQTESLISDITSSALKSMQTSGVAEDDMYEYVIKIRDAVKSILGVK